MKVGNYIFLILLSSCVGSPGGEYPEFYNPNQSHTYDFSTSSNFTYAATDIQVNSSGASLTPLFQSIDTFSDAVDTDWTGFVTGVANIVFSDTGTAMSYDCANSWAGIEYNVVTNYSDYMLYAEVTPTSWDLAAQPIGIVARYMDNQNFYMAQTFSNTHYFYKMEAGVWSAPMNTAAGFTPSAGVTYAMKVRVQGNATLTLQYKVWDASGAEPVGWSLTATELEPPNNTFDMGSLALACFAGDGSWDNVRYYDGAATTNYTTSVSTLVFPTVTGVSTVSQWSSLNISSTIPTSDNIRYDISVDGGATFLTYSGGWTTNAGGYATAISLSTLNANITSLGTTSKTFTLRAYFASNDGSTTPSIQSAVLNYQVAN